MSENPFLAGNFGPVDDELTVDSLSVTGEIPKELAGHLLRIGPNPIDPDPKNHHWFLGSGMVHDVHIRDGKALSYRNRYVRDDHVVAAKGWPPVEGPVHEMDLGGGVANTNVISHAGKTFAIVEAGNLPVELDDQLDTVRRSDFDGTLTGGFSAHPHLDPQTGELHAAVYSPAWEHIRHLVVGADGRVQRSVDVPVPGRPMVHDCMFTQNYFILLDLPVILDVGVAEAGFSLPYKWTPDYGARIGLLPRNGEADEVTWHEVEPCFIFHPMNAYEDDRGHVVMDVVRHSKMFDHDMNGPSEGTSSLDRWVIDPTKSQASEHRIDDRSQEFPRFDERRAGQSYRFGYTANVGYDSSLGGIKKHDLEKGTGEVHNEGEERFFLEPVFVPASPDAAEDDGWILAYVYDRSTNGSDVTIFHAQDFSGAPQATIHLPQRVPFGFHGNWVPENH